MQQLPPEGRETDTLKAIDSKIEAFLEKIRASESSSLPESVGSDYQNASASSPLTSDSSNLLEKRMEGQTDTVRATAMSRTDGSVPEESSRSSVSHSTEAVPRESSENESRTPTASIKRTESQKEIIEQFEPGVYVTVILRPNGVKIFKRVKFRYDNMVDPIELHNTSLQIYSLLSNPYSVKQQIPYRDGSNSCATYHILQQWFTIN